MEDDTFNLIKEAEAEYDKKLRDAESQKKLILENASAKSVQLISEKEKAVSEDMEKKLHDQKLIIARKKKELLSDGAKKLRYELSRSEKNRESAIRFIVREFEKSQNV